MLNNKRLTFFLGTMFSINLLFLFYLKSFFDKEGYLPAPFIGDKANTFMDFFNVLYWSYQDGIYTTWNSVYPPLNFLILRAYQIIAIPEFNYFSDGFEIRKINGEQIVLILLFYVLCLWMTLSVALKELENGLHKNLLYLIIFLSSLFLFSLERANLIIICLPLLAFFVVAKSEIIKAVLFALIVNLKPYLLILYLVQLLNEKSFSQNKDFIFLAPVFSLILFFVSGIVLNQEFYFMPLNLIGFGVASGVVSPLETLAYPSSIASFSAFKYLLLGGVLFKIPALICLLYLLRTIFFIRKYYISQDYLYVFAIVMLLNLPIHVGGYAALLYVPIIGIFLRNKEYFLLGQILLATFCSFWDFIPLLKFEPENGFSYLSNQEMLIAQTLNAGSLVRPLSNFIALVYLVKKIEKDANEKTI